MREVGAGGIDNRRAAGSCYFVRKGEAVRGPFVPNLVQVVEAVGLWSGCDQEWYTHSAPKDGETEGSDESEHVGRWVEALSDRNVLSKAEEDFICSFETT